VYGYLKATLNKTCKHNFRRFKNQAFYSKKYEKQDQQGKAAFNERNPHMTQQQEPMARSSGGPQT
jgi:hypothetical protein